MNLLMEKTTISQSDVKALQTKISHAEVPQLVLIARQLTNRPHQLNSFLEKGGLVSLVQALRGLSPVGGEEGEAIDQLLSCLGRANLTVEMAQEGRLIYQLNRLQRQNKSVRTDQLIRKLIQNNRAVFEQQRKKIQQQRRRTIQQDKDRREKDRRLKDDKKRSRSRALSQSSQSQQRRSKSRSSKKKIKWLKDDQILKIKFFRIDEEPSAKGLTHREVQEYNKALRHSSDWQCASSEQLRHRESRLQFSSMRQFKEQQKALQQKLTALIQQIAFRVPRRLKNPTPVIVTRQAQLHSQRIANKLTCYYRPGAIPPQPQTSLLNEQEAPPASVIPFERSAGQSGQLYRIVVKHVESGLRGILRKGGEQPMGDEMTPQILNLIQQIQKNKELTVQQLTDKLKPIQNHSQYQKIYNNLVLAKQIEQQRQQAQMHAIPNSIDILRQISQMNNPNAKIDQTQYRCVNSKFKTVHCKYYHGPQGCQRGDQCTYIHNKSYPGQPTPQMLQQKLTTTPGVYPMQYPMYYGLPQNYSTYYYQYQQQQQQQQQYPYPYQMPQGSYPWPPAK